MLTKEQKKERRAARAMEDAIKAQAQPGAEIRTQDKKDRAIQFIIEEGRPFMTFRTNSLDVFHPSGIGGDVGYKEVSVRIESIEILTEFAKAFAVRLAEATKLHNAEVAKINEAISLILPAVLEFSSDIQIEAPSDGN